MLYSANPLPNRILERRISAPPLATPRMSPRMTLKCEIQEKNAEKIQKGK